MIRETSTAGATFPGASFHVKLWRPLPGVDDVTRPDSVRYSPESVVGWQSAPTKVAVNFPPDRVM